MNDAALVDELTAYMRFEPAVAARRLAVIAEITARQCDDEDDGIAHCVIDGWEFAAAQISAACNLSARQASKQMRIAQALRERLPKTAAVFAAGDIPASVISTITWRTGLVDDPEALMLIDAALAGTASGFGSLSDAGLEQNIDKWVDKFDPAAVRRSRTAAKGRHVQFGDRDDPNGVVSVWGRLLATDAVIIKARLDDIAATVCPNDPRSLAERRADALGTLAVGADRLACQCGDSECSGSGNDPRATAVTVYVVTDRVPVAEPRESGSSGAPTAKTRPAPESMPVAGAGSDPTATDPDPATRSNGKSSAPTTFGAGAILGGGIIPAPLLADLIAGGAKIRPLIDPAVLTAEPRHRPSGKLTAFVRARAMSCTFPGCNQPAHRCDLDHLVPWPAGATHPGNLHPLCRRHHLIKTFHAGPGGWTATAKPDGTIEWTAPTAHRYTKTPGAAILFPHANIDTPIPRPGPISAVSGVNRGLMMPTRRRTRAQDRAQRTKAERARNEVELALSSDSDPPPF